MRPLTQDNCVFQRVEKKYLLTLDQKRRLLERIGPRLEEDRYGKSTVCSLYLDTADSLLIRNSLDGGTYKEKLRLRCYGTPGPDSLVFLEIKKKFQGVVYKRRAAMTLTQAEGYLDRGVKPFESQIMSEIDYAMIRYRRPKPVVAICCEREAFCAREQPGLRLTFDSGIRCRTEALRLEDGAWGQPILGPDQVLLEVKTGLAMPLWLTRALDENGIYPTSFSKYGTAYCGLSRRQKGEQTHVCNS